MTRAAPAFHRREAVCPGRTAALQGKPAPWRAKLLVVEDRTCARSLAGSVDAERLGLGGCELLIGEGAAGVEFDQLVNLLRGRVHGLVSRW